ncbi:MAG TPA: rod shape-determining protein MreC [Bryobacteraceae bacterium]|jgi:rod shape-determining protein MreC|nr:rod shape-determining protein MreC [Bryobacteraceae bacterium]
MESILYRYRNIAVLLVVILAQIVLLAWQVRSDSDVPMVRVWAVTAVTPVASGIETVRNTTTGIFSSYFALKNAREQSRQLRTEVDRLRLENQLLKNELTSAQRAEELAGFQTRSPSRMIGARVIGATPGAGSKSVLIDRGSQSGVRRGMAVVTPDGIVGRVLAVFPFASQVISVTDPGFAAGVESQKGHVHGILKGLGNSARVDFIPTGQKVETGEIFFTSGEDRIFPKGLPVGKVTSVKEGGNFQDIIVQPAGTETAPEEVLVIVDPVNQAIPEAPAPDTPVFLAPDVKPEDQTSAAGGPVTTTGKLMDRYKKIGDAQKHVFGEGVPGSLPPNFNLKVPGVNAPAAPAGTTPAPPVAQSATPKPAGGAVPASNSVKPPPVPSTAPPSAAAVTPRPAAKTPPSPGPVIPKPVTPKPPATASTPEPQR